MNYERRGVLHPQYVYRNDGRDHEQRLVVYSPDELTKLGKRMKRGSVRDPGEVAARAFELFREGKKLEEVVVEIRAAPETIEHLHEKWLDMGGARFVISPLAKEMLETIVGPFESVAELIEKLKPS